MIFVKRLRLRPHRLRIIWFSILSVVYVAIYILALVHLRGRVWEKRYASAGTVDLTQVDFSQTLSLSLSGEWNFHWGTLGDGITPPALASSPRPLIVPGSWPEIKDTLFGSRFGYGTYHLRLKLNRGQIYIVQFGSLTSAARIWVNEELRAQIGTPGTSASSHRAATRLVSVIIRPDQEWNSLIVEVSNFDHNHAGLLEAPRISDARFFENMHSLRIAYDLIMALILLVLGLQGIIIGFTWLSESASLYLGLFSICLGVQTLLTGSRLGAHIGLPWHIYLRIEYLSYIAALPCFVLFVRHSFPGDPWRRFPMWLTIASCAYSALIILLSPAIFTKIVQPFALIVILAGGYASVVCFRAIKNGQRDAIFVSLGFILVFGGIIIDLLNVLQSQVQLLIAPATAALFVHLSSLAMADRIAFSLFRSHHSVQKLRRMDKTFSNNRKMLRTARLMGLQERVNPHFLLNALTMVHSLVVSDPARAENSLIHLADLYRSLTNSANKLQIPFASEWDLISSYLELQNARFRGQVGFDLGLKGDLKNVQVAPLALQQIVENCFKHGFVAGKDESGLIRIRVTRFRDGLRMTVDDNGRGLQDKVPTGETISSIRERMNMLYDVVRLRLKSRAKGGTRVLLVCSNLQDR